VKPADGTVEWPPLAPGPTVDPGLTLGQDPWYGPTDLQVVTAIQSLDLDVFPFGAFDPYGRLKVDPGVTEQLKRELRDVLSQPVWTDFFKVLSLLDNPGYDAYALGFRATPKGVKLLLFRRLNWNSSPQACATLQHSIGRNILPQLREYAGRRYVVQPRWIEVVREILGLLGGGLADEDEDADPAEAAAAIGWRAVLEGILGLLEIANKIGRAHRVDATVVWAYSSFSRMPPEQTKKWYYIGAIGDYGAGACTGVLWDKGGRCVWSWANTWPWPAGFPFARADLQSALYPSGLSGDGSVPEGVEDAPPPDPV